MGNVQNHTNSQKGDKTNMKNYRPIANLCSMSKIVAKLIMQRIIKINKQGWLNW